MVVEGLLARSAPVFAGPLGSLTFELESSGRHADPARWMADGPEVRAGNSAGLIRLARAGEWDADARRLEFATADDARKAVLRLLEEPAVDARLHAMCGLTGGPLITWTSQQLHAGTLKLLWRKRARVAYATAAATAPATPPPRSRPSRPPPSTPSPQYSTFPPDLDAAAVAAVLKDAARDGVPFCEECRKAQEARAGAAGEAA